MLFVGALLCVVVCQVSLGRAFMRVRVPCLTTRLNEELSLQQVRELLPLGQLLLVPLELKAPLFGSCLNSNRFGGSV